MNWHFRTIGMGTFNYRRAAKRLSQEVYATGRFKTSIGANERFLKNSSTRFWKEHSNVLHSRTPGFGWWIWKPEFVKVCLDQIPRGDGLFYLDAGTVLGNSLEDLDLLDALLKDGEIEPLIGSNSQSFAEYKYSSNALMSYCNLEDSQRTSNQFWAGFFMVQNNAPGITFVNSWKQMLCQDNHRFLINKEDNFLENPDLIHHMYDQAVFSCLMKASMGKSISIDETGQSGLIRPLRHRYGYGFFESPNCIRFFYHVLAFLSKVKLYVERRLISNSLQMAPNNHSTNDLENP